MGSFARLLLGILLVAVGLAACKPAAPVAEQKPRRKSFAESSAWQPTAGSPAPAGAAASNSQQQAGQVQGTWDQARQATDDTERQRLANEALRQTREMADQPSPAPQR